MLNELMDVLVDKGLALSNSMYYELEHKQIRLAYDRYDMETLAFGPAFTSAKQALAVIDAQRERAPQHARSLDADWEATLRREVEARTGRIDEWRERLFAEVDTVVRSKGWTLAATEHDDTRALLGER